MFGNRSPRMDPRNLHVDEEGRAQWPRGHEHPLVVGATVLCAAGLAQITKLCGKTGDGSRLLELKLMEGDGKPFFAAASNVLVQPLTT